MIREVWERLHHGKSQHPSLLEQIESVEAAMATTPAGTRWFVLLDERSRLLAIAAREHGHTRVTDVEHDEPATSDGADEDVTGVGDLSGDLLGTGHCHSHAGPRTATPASDQNTSNHGQISLPDGPDRVDLGAVREAS